MNYCPRCISFMPKKGEDKEKCGNGHEEFGSICGSYIYDYKGFKAGKVTRRVLGLLWEGQEAR